MKVSDAIKNIGLTIFTVLILLIVVEALLRLTGRYMTDNEKHGDKFNSVYHSPIEKRWYHIYDPHKMSSQTLQEYAYSIYANNEGLLDTEFTVSKAPHTFRILVIGDSFIQGMGASVDSTCPKQLERILKEHFNGTPDIEVWNCGIGGSDPVYEFLLLKNRLLQYKPDYIIEELNATDITDVIQRGGSGRFNADSTVSYRPAPSIEPLYIKSYICRSVVRDLLRYDWMLLSPKQQVEERVVAAKIIDSSLINFQSLCATNQIPLLITFVPFKGEMLGYQDYTMAPFIKLCNANHIAVLDLKNYFETNNLADTKSLKLYWSIDMHFNGVGYGIFAQSLSVPLIKYIDSLNKTPVVNN